MCVSLVLRLGFVLFLCASISSSNRLHNCITHQQTSFETASHAEEGNRKLSFCAASVEAASQELHNHPSKTILMFFLFFFHLPFLPLIITAAVTCQINVLRSP